MKLIIEIPIDLLERTKSGDYNFGDDLARNEVIANGTPYNPTGDCISREALKEAFEDLFYNDYDDQLRTERLIDNAPPVPQVVVFTETADEKAVADLKAELQSVIEPRPQGEWILKETDCDDGGNNRYECTNCHYSDVHAGSAEVPYCWHCGAEMKGGAE